MRNTFLILFLILSVVGCIHKTTFRQDKIQFIDNQSLSEKEEMRELVSDIFSQDTFLIKYYDIGCYHYFKTNIQVSSINDTFKIGFDTIHTHTQMQRDFTYLPKDGIAFYLNRNQLDSMEQIFSKYSNRLYAMNSTSTQTYELVGSDTSVRVENNYYFEGNPLQHLERFFEIRKVKTITQERSADTSALDIYWSAF